MLLEFLVFLILFLIISLILVVIYYTKIKTCPVHKCPECFCKEVSYYKVTPYDKIKELSSLNDIYSLSLSSNILELKKNDVLSKTVNTVWKSPILSDPKYISANFKGQLCVKNSKDEEIYVYPPQPLLNEYKEFYIYLNNNGNIVFQRYLTGDEILYTGTF